MLILLLISFFVTSCLSTWKSWCFSWQNVLGPPQKPSLWTEKPQSTSSAIFGVETAAKCCELKWCPDRVPNRTRGQGKIVLFGWTLSPNFFRLNWTFRLPPKRQLSILLNFFFPLTNLFLTFVVFACFATTRVTMRFRAKTRDSAQGYIHPVYATSYWWPFGADGRTVTWLLRHYQNFLAW